MKCPYACNIEQVNQWKYENEDGLSKNTVHKLIEKKTYVDCLKEDCGAWQNNRCNFNQGHNV